MTEEDIYKKRDFILGEIHAKVQCIPDMKKDISKLNNKVSVIEFKSGVFGGIGGVLAILGLYFKDHIINWK